MPHQARRSEALMMGTEPLRSPEMEQQQQQQQQHYYGGGPQMYPERHSVPNSIPRKPIASVASGPRTSSPPPHEHRAPQPEVDRRRRGGLFSSSGSWLPEIGSLVFAAGALAASVVLLLVYQDQPLPNWPALITLNAVVSIFTSTFKAALIYPVAEGISELKWLWFSRPRPLGDLDRFDAASRGPMGALKLLLRRTSNVLAALGAIIIILALAVDPFTQQILQYYTCLTPSAGTASIARVNSYESAGGHIFAGQTNLDFPMNLAIWQGLLDPPLNASAGVSFDCATGNCTFASSLGERYHSIAMCYEVQDISHLITEKDMGDGDGQMRYSLPSEAYVDTSSVFLSPDVVNNAYSSNDTDRVGVFDFQILMMVCGSANDTCRPLKPFAFGANMYPCVQAYSDSHVDNFVLSEHALNSTRLQYIETSSNTTYSIAGNFPSTPGLDCAPSPNKVGNKTVPTVAAPNGQRFINQSAPIDSNTLWYDPGCTYAFGWGPWNALQYNKKDWFSANFSLASGYGSPSTALEGPAWLKRLYAAGRANMTFSEANVAGLAHAMTATMRSAKPDPVSAAASLPDQGAAQGFAQLPASGIMFDRQTCVSIVWPWLALPAALFVLTVLFLAITIAKSRGALHAAEADMRRSLWKSSVLPLLWCGLPDGLRESHGPMNRVADMKERSDELRVSLLPGDGRRMARSRTWGLESNE